MFHMISHSAEFLLQSVADVFTKIVFTYILSSEHIGLIHVNTKSLALL